MTDRTAALEAAQGDHTPGPWTVELYGDVGSDNLVIHSDADNRICFMATPGAHSDRKVIAANARLVAAAPDMARATLSAAKEADRMREALEKAAKQFDFAAKAMLPAHRLLAEGLYFAADSCRAALLPSEGTKP